MMINTGLKRRNKFLAIIIVAIVVCLIVLQEMYARKRAELKEYFDCSDKVCKLPDIENGFIPQGLTYHLDSNSILISGYNGNGDNSSIYIISCESGDKKRILLQTIDGNDFKGHAGGITVKGDGLYLAGSTEGCMYKFCLKELLDAKDNYKIRPTEIINLKSNEDYIRVSFTVDTDDILFSGEYHSAPFFNTHKSHVVVTSDGKQSAYLLGFVVGEQGDVFPTCVYSIPDNVQGVCFDDKNVYLSQTDGVFSARILTYTLKNIPQQGMRNIFGVEVPLYIITEDNAEKKTQIPPMSEEIIAIDGKLYILYEAASDRYKIGKKMELDYLFATPIEYFR